MKREIPVQVVVAIIVVVLVVVGWLGFQRFRPGPKRANVGLGPPADLIRNQPPAIGPDGRPMNDPGTAVSAGAGGIGPPPAPGRAGGQGTMVPPPPSYGGPQPPGPPTGGFR